MALSKGFDGNDRELQTKDDDEFLGTLEKWFSAAKRNRQVYDWNWYICQNYYKGNQYIQFHKKTFQVVTPPKIKGQVRLVVNKIYPILRAIRNFATSYRPRWFVTANSTSEEEVNNGEKAAQVLDDYYDRLHMFVLINGVTNYASKYGIGYFQYGWDDEGDGLDNQKGEAWVVVRDPFDVYLDPVGMETGDIQNCRFIDVVVSRPIQDILNNPEYDKAASLTADDISSDMKRAAADWKNLLLLNEFPDGFDKEGNLATKLVHDIQYKKRVKQDDGTYDSEVWVATWIDGHLLRNKKTEFSKYNLIPVPSDNNPNEIYGEGYVKNLIGPQKILNRLESQVVEYNNLVNRGRIMADKDAGVTKITNETGEIIEHNAGSQVQFWNPTGLAPDIHQQIARVNTYMEEISGVRQTFLGGNAVGLRSGVALEAMKAQTANNLQDLKDNIEMALAQLGEAILEMVANKVVVPRTVQRKDGNGKPANFMVKGQVGVKPKEKLKNTFIIGNQNSIKVTIGTGLAYTKEGLTDKLDKLLAEKAIAPATYLKALEFGDVEGAIKESREQAFNDAMMTHIAANGMPGATGLPGGAPMPAQQTPPPEKDTVSISAKLTDLSPQERAQALMKDGIQSDVANGSVPPGMAANPTPGAPITPGAPAPAQGTPPVGGQAGGDSWTKLADDEDHAMLQGKVIPPTKGAPKEHTAIHVAWSQSPEVQQNEHLMQAILTHIKGEEEMQGAPHTKIVLPKTKKGK